MKSEKIKVTYTKPVANTKQEISEIKKPAKNTVNNSVTTSRTVYTTPSGKKYHYSRECAEKNAKATTESSAKVSYNPCKKCVE